MDNDLAVKTLSALAQSTRFDVFRLLMKSYPDGIAAGAIAEKLEVQQNTLSSHLNILSNAGVIKSQRKGRSLVYKANIEATKCFMDYLVVDCCKGHPEICALPAKRLD